MDTGNIEYIVVAQGNVGAAACQNALDVYGKYFAGEVLALAVENGADGKGVAQQTVGFFNS